ncbi:sulfatase [Chthoniobacter flavus Ellin428]|uniref:Sulfatase n=1 Tax=Chthoniobacter flavus Ellin428 TaxID=497964 RepID=B4D4M5_9BACT|nr:arylsulfatase [Chthoniobacter flavus]EDY18478.1 sulfatase [Chthoniobacter flavus Ellin428]TCO91059.1 arylsulfatase [Chthoniobacter flavus]
MDAFFRLPLHRSLAFLLAGIALLAFTGHANSAPAARPNILIILADDVGYADIGCYGGEIHTPNLDALAADGLRFTQFYNCARCCPARASLLTGLYPHQAGVGLMTSDRGASFPGAGDQGEAFPGYRGSLNSSCVTIAQVLKTAGYRTAAVGKWHVGDSEPPTSRGFDDFYGFIRGYAVDSWEPRMMIRLPAGKPQRSYAPGEYFATDAITDHAIDFIADMHKTQAPWMLYVAYQVAHFPIGSRPEDMAGYPEIYAQGWDKIREQRLAKQKEIGLLSTGTPLTPRSRIPKPAAAKRIGSLTEDGKNPAWDSLPAERRADLAQRMSVYAGMITGMDRNIGRIVADLRASGQLDNTLIFFLSDNGACAEWEPFGFEMANTPNPQPGTGINQGTQALPNKLYQGDELARMGSAGTRPSYGSGWANACNTPWRLYKHYDHEGGISSPFIVHWPAGVKAKNEYRSQMGHLIDLMATCIDVSGAKYPAEFDGHKILPPEGISLTPTFANQPLEREYLAWEHEGNRAIREGKWKLVSLSGAPWELYNMDVDRVELHDLAGNEPQRVKDMAAKWDAWAQRTHVLPRPPGPTGPSAAKKVVD